MMEFLQGLQPAVVGVLLYLAAWGMWRLCLSPARQFDPEAVGRADLLLSELLTETERRQLAQERHLTVASPTVLGRTYRIPAGPGWVEMYESGTLVKRLCVLPMEGLPPGDVLLMHKLMIEGNEQDYLRLANVRWARSTCQATRIDRGQAGQLAIG